MKEQLNFKLEIFEGPLDLMLSLISKHKLDIQDIEISILLEQFLDYIDKSLENNIELAGEFLEAAARLIYIKTVSLLPKHEAEKLKKELEGALIEYALCKAVAERLREHYIGNLIFTRNTLEIEADLTYELTHPVSELLEAISAVSDRDKLKELLRQPPKQSQVNPAVTVDYISIFSKIIYVLKNLRKQNRIAIADLFSDFSPEQRSARVATFLALLELSSHGRITFSEDSEYIELEVNNNWISAE